MPHILNASDCPAVQQSTGFLPMPSISIAANSVCAESTTGMDFAQEVIAPHARRLDDAANFGGACACAVLVGSNAGNEFALSASGTPLRLSVLKGKAICGGLIVLGQDSTIDVPDGGGSPLRVWIWLLQTQVLSKTVTTTPPSLSVCIGSCVTQGGAIISVDTSGVLYKIGSELVRYSADPGVPTDTPPALLTFTQRTAFGRFDWTSAAYEQVGCPEVSADPTSTANGMSWFRSDIPAMSRWTGGGVKRATYT